MEKKRGKKKEKKNNKKGLDLTVRVSIICSSGYRPPWACGADRSSSIPAGRAGCRQGAVGRVLCRGAMEPGSLLRAQPLLCILEHRYWGQKEEGGKKCIMFLFRSADHCEILPAQPCPPPSHPRPSSPAKETVLARGTCCLSLRGTCCLSPNRVCHVPPSRSHHRELLPGCC